MGAMPHLATRGTAGGKKHINILATQILKMTFTNANVIRPHR